MIPAPLHVVGAGTTDIGISDNVSSVTERWVLRAGQMSHDDFAINQRTTAGALNTRLHIDSGGKVGINTVNPSQNLEVDGGVLASSVTLTATGNSAYSLTSSSGIRMTGGCLTFADGSVQCAKASSDLIRTASTTVSATTSKSTFGVCQATITFQARNYPLVIGFSGSAEGDNLANDLGWACLINGTFCPGTNATRGITMQENINNEIAYNLSSEFLIDPQVGTINICISFACGPTSPCTTTIPGSGPGFSSIARFYVYELPR